MAKYTIDYACGHGSHVEQLYGKGSERERRIEWEEANRVCPDCFKAQLKEADEKAEPKAKISVLCNGLAVSLKVSVTGQTARNKEELSALGLGRRQGQGGFLDLLSTKANWYFGNEFQVTSPEELGDKGKAIVEALEGLGYSVSADLDPISVDYALAVEFFRTKAKETAAKAEKLAADPKPPLSPLRARIEALEKETGSKWNGRIYGKKGSLNFYVNNVKHDVTDAEAAERDENLKLWKAWKERNQ